MKLIAVFLTVQLFNRENEMCFDSPKVCKHTMRMSKRRNVSIEKTSVSNKKKRTLDNVHVTSNGEIIIYHDEKRRESPPAADTVSTHDPNISIISP